MLEELYRQLRQDGFDFEVKLNTGKYEKIKTDNFRGWYATTANEHCITLTLNHWGGDPQTQKVYRVGEPNGNAGEIDEFIKTKTKEAEEQKRQANESAKQKAKEMWEASVPCELPDRVPYLNRKHLKSTFGARVDSETHAIIRVPCKDIEGTIWGIQCISPNGDKRFLKGQRKEGTFHLIGTPIDTIYITEGFATGASVHLATGKAVAVAFDANNLKKVAIAFRKQNPSIKIIIAGDNDEKLTGQHAAESAAREVSGAFVCPDEQGKDWNDLFIERGMEFLRTTIESKTKTHFVSKIYDEFTVKDAEQARLTTNLEPDWIVEGMFAKGSISIIAAEPKAGKSTLTRYLAKCIVDEEPFLGRACKKSRVLLLQVEEKDRFVVRQNIKMGLKNEKDFLFHTATTPTKAIEKAEKLIGVYKPDIVVFDTMFKIITPEDENKYSEVTGLIAQIQNLAHHYGIHILSVHHTNKGNASGFNKILGTQAIRGAFDYNMLLSIEGDPDEDENAQRFIRSEGREGTFFRVTALNFHPETASFSIGSSIKAFKMQQKFQEVLTRFAEVNEERSKVNWKKAALGDNHQREIFVQRAIKEGFLVASGKEKQGSPMFVWNRNKPAGENDQF